MKTTKEIVELSAVIADLDIADQERVFAVVRALRPQPVPVPVSLVLHPTQPPPLPSGTPWPRPTITYAADPHFAACAAPMNLGQVWTGEAKFAIGNTAACAGNPTLDFKVTS